MIEKLTKEQEDLMAVVRDEWVDIALYKNNLDKEELVAGVKWLYYSSNLSEPDVVFVDGPKDFADKLSSNVGASVRASVWASASVSSLSYDSDFASWYDYYARAGIIDKQENAEKYIGFLKSGAFYCMFFEKVAYVMRRPTVVKQDGRKRLHATDCPAMKFADGTEFYMLNGVKFDKEWHTKIANDELSPNEIFAIDNLEHRRIAYEFMDKSKMKQLKDFKLLDETTDEYGNTMKVISFNIQQLDDNIKMLNVICPSTGREYFLGTDETTCEKAKARSFGFDSIKFDKEW